MSNIIFNRKLLNNATAVQVDDGQNGRRVVRFAVEVDGEPVQFTYRASLSAGLSVYVDVHLDGALVYSGKPEPGVMSSVCALFERARGIAFLSQREEVEVARQAASAKLERLGESLKGKGVSTNEQ